MPRLTRIYTRTGDRGETALGDGRRVPKDSLRIATYGTVDELNAAIGVALAHGVVDALREPLRSIQNALFHLGADLCVPQPEGGERPAGPRVEERHVRELEALIDRLNERVGPLENFILPGGALAAAQLHVARTVCRRAERLATSLARAETISPHIIEYLNRLSDALFVLSRYENHERGVAEPLWDSRA